MVDVTLLAAGGMAAVSALAGWAIAARRESGNVGTTDADRLWDQNQALLRAYIEDNAKLRERVGELERRAHEAEVENRECNRRNEVLEGKVAALERALSS